MTAPTGSTSGAPTRQGAPRRPRPQIVLEVLATSWVSPHLVRVRLGGDGMADFNNNEFTDRYVKIWFAKPELDLAPPYDVDALRERLDPADLPVTRTYTVRRVDPDHNWLEIDFVVHGDEGLAGPWARDAKRGDLLAFSGPGGAYRPDPEVDWHLLVGDESAQPAVTAAVEALPAGAVGVAVLEVGGPEEEVVISAPNGVHVQWVHRGGSLPGTTSVLADAVAALPWPDGRVQVFAHGERESMKALREVFKQRGVDRQALSLSGYWAYGRSEDRFQAEKREPIGQILD